VFLLLARWHRDKIGLAYDCGVIYI